MTDYTQISTSSPNTKVSGGANTTAPADVKHKIAVIIPYFGTFPNYIDLVFRSFSFNKSINFIIFTDCNRYTCRSENINIIKTTFEDFRELFQSAFSSPISLKTPYKLCDFRPTYGYVLAKKGFLDGYDFWGHCDLDVMFGDIRKFIPSTILDKYNKVGTRGHLTLYRNMPNVNEYFMLPGAQHDYRDVLSSDAFFDFDEQHGMNTILRRNSIPQYSSRGLLGDLCQLSHRLVISEWGVGKSTTNHLVQAFFWEDGHTFQAYWRPGFGIILNELAYLHMEKRKFQPLEFGIDDALRAVYVTPSAFVRKEGPVRMADLFNNNSYAIRRWRSDYKKRLKAIEKTTRKYGPERTREFFH